ncbi:MAG: ABC transporter permease, partial [Pseudomonadota bacterium]
MIDFITAWLSSLPAFMTPLLLASLGLLLCERAGVLNLGVEGVMAVSAMTGAVIVLGGYGPWTALLVAGLAAIVVSFPFMVAVVVFRAPMIPAGLALFALGIGVSQAVGRGAAHKPFAGLQPLPWPEALVDLPLIGRMLFEQDGVVILTLAAAIVTARLLYWSRIGLKLRAVGEDPATAEASGVDVQLYQIGALLTGTFLIGLAGAYLSVGGSQIWTEG